MLCDGHRGSGLHPNFCFALLCFALLRGKIIAKNVIFECLRRICSKALDFGTVDITSSAGSYFDSELANREDSVLSIPNP